MPRESPPWPKTYTATEAPKEVLDLAARVMPLLLASDDATRIQLRKQYARARIQQVELTGAGFFVTFEIPADVARTTPPNLQGGDVHIRVEGVEHGAGCVLFVRDGVLSMLEGYTYGEEWPEHPLIVRLREATPLAPPGEPTRRLIDVGGLVETLAFALPSTARYPPRSRHCAFPVPHRPPRIAEGTVAVRVALQRREVAGLLEVRGKAPEGPDELALALLGRLPEDESVWIKLCELYEVQLRFGIHMTGWNRGFGLSPATTTRVASLRASMVFNIYAYDGEEGILSHRLLRFPWRR